jgi:hypothetical protein
MRKYQCHKIVEAGKITDICPAPRADMVILKLDNNTDHYVPAEFMEKHHPAVGGYLVRYSDDYLSFSPAEPFEMGYTLIVESQPS